MKPYESTQFREQIRILERRLGLLNKYNSSCCQQITLAQCHALVEIGRSETIALKDLSTLLTLDISTMSRTVDSLVKAGFVKRTASVTDRRSVDIQLLEKGTELFNDIEMNMNDNFAKIFEFIPYEEQANVSKSLDIIIQAFTSLNINQTK